MIKLKPLAALKDSVPSLDSDGCFAIEFSPGMTISDALEKTDIPGSEIKFSLLVNNARRKKEDTLRDGDIVVIMPLLAGG